MAKHGLWAAASLTLSLMATSAQAAPDLVAANARLTVLLDKNYPALDALYRDLHQTIAISTRTPNSGCRRSAPRASLHSISARRALP